jgi:hypothetical protein
MHSSEKILSVKKRIELFIRSDRGKIILKISRWIFLTAILVWLGINLHDIGWQSVWQNLPVHPLFYLIFLMMYLSAPIADVIIYRHIWDFNLWRSIHAFIKKRILNTDVVGYSGEVYFFTWARNKIGLSSLEIGETIRDVNILSAIASNSKSILFLLIFGYWAKEQISMLLGSVSSMYFVMIGVILLILIPIVVRFRRYIFSTSFQTARFIFSIYFLRLTITTALQILMWMVVIPQVPLVTWVIYSAISILVSRIPVSNKKLIFAGVGVEMAASLQIPQEAIFGLLICVAALEKILNFAFYLFFAVIMKLDSIERAIATPSKIEQQSPELESESSTTTGR